MLNPDFQPCPPLQSAIAEEFIKWVCLGLKKVTTVKMMVKIQKKTINSSKIYQAVPDPVFFYTESHTTGQQEVVDPVLFHIGAHCLLLLSMVVDPEFLHIGCCRPLHVCLLLRGQTGKETRR